MDKQVLVQRSCLSCLSLCFCRYNKPVRGRKINWMKAGLIESDTAVTVSPYYAAELVSGIEKGVELDNISRMKVRKGIVNGMDVNEWNPATDKHISANYDAETVGSSYFGFV